MSESKYIIQNIYQPTPGLVVIEASDKNGTPVFAYRPGQYAMISYRNQQGKTEDKHAFSMASSPTQKNFIRFGIRVQGSFTKGLLDLKVGDELLISGPFGNFIYDEQKYPESVMIAGGIGITPFYSALQYATDLKLNNKLQLIYSARTAAGATFLEEIRALAKTNPNISLFCSLTEETGKPIDKNIIHQRLDAEVLNNCLGPIEGKTFFLCGPPPFMAAIINNLLSLGVKKEQIKMEEFSMIPDKDLWSRLRNVSVSLALAVFFLVVSFTLISRSATSANSKKTYDPIAAGKLNQAAYDRMIAIYEAKNKALADLNQQILDVANGQTSTSSAISNPSVPIITNPTPAPTPIPTPRTRVS